MLTIEAVQESDMCVTMAAATLAPSSRQARDRIRWGDRVSAETTATVVRDGVVIGSGPAGYTAALYAARVRLQPAVFAGSVSAGGALMTTTEVDNFPGFPTGIRRPDLMAGHAHPGGPLRRADHRRRHGRRQPHRRGQAAHRLRLNVHRAKAVIVATGSGYRKLGLPREAELSGCGVSWCAMCERIPLPGPRHRRDRRRGHRHGPESNDPERVQLDHLR
jgi:alkyl hydroperoxide reductase subunit AhpF